MFRSISSYLGSFCLLISFFSLLNFIYSQYFNFYLNLNSYLYTLLISFCSGVLLIYINKKKNNKITIYEKIIIIIFGFFYFPLLISIPYYLSIYNLTFIDCYFEAISGFTSTGFTIFNNIKYIDETLIIWRSTSQWLGGLFFLFSLILLLDVFNYKIKNFLTSFISINLIETKKQILKIFILYLFLTFIIFILLIFSGVRLFDSFNLSMTIISSGGFIPSNNLNEIIFNNKQILTMCFAMLFSYFNLYFIYNLVFFKRKLSFFYEDVYLLYYLLIIFFLFLIFFNNFNNFYLIIFSIVSSVSSIGISFNDMPDRLIIVFLSLTIIGGGYFSTSSGIKLIKLISLFKYSLNELLLIARPKYILRTNLGDSGINIENDEMKKYFLSFIFFLICIFTLSFILSLFGSDFSDSLTLSILTLTNTVNSSAYGINNFNFYDLSIFAKIFVMLFMIIARVELLVFLLLFKKFFFKN